jgi:SAM-dependent methyltransferase
MVESPKYQKELSRQSPILLDYSYKKPKVDKMIAVLRDYGVIGNGRKKLAVDIGCSAGFFSRGLAPYFDVVIGIDIDSHALALARNQKSEGLTAYLIGDSMSLPLADASADLVVCNHVYEHVPSPEKLFSEIHRVLTVHGICYLGAASRLTPVEPHYHLPFLSWLPKTLAHCYMRMAGKGDYYYENLRTYWGIMSLLGRFDVLDYTLKVIHEPDKYAAGDLLPQGGVLRNIPFFVWKIFYTLLPSYIFILKKSEY